MYNILIVDDEKIHRKGILSLLEDICPEDMLWEASDGTDALEILEHVPCEIIISDIRMAKMDGLSLLKRVKERRNEIFFILLSGYAEFSYAKEALALQASAYLLKPVNRLELQETLEEVKKKLKGHLEEEEKAADLKEKLKEALPVYMERILNQYLRYPGFSAGDQLTSLLPLEQQGYLMLTRLSKRHPSCVFAEEEKRDIGYLIKKSMDPHSSLTFEVHHMKNTFATLVLDFELPKEKVFWGIRQQLERKGYGEVYFAVSFMQENLYLKGTAAFEEACTALSYAFYEDQHVLRAGEQERAEKNDSRPWDAGKLITAIQEGGAREAKLMYEAVILETKESGLIPPDVLKRKAVLLFYQALRNLEPMLRRENMPELYERDHLLMESDSLKSLLKGGEQLIFRIIKSLSTQRDKAGMNPMLRCREYLENHYMDEISLEMVAGIFHFNTSYFSTLFKNTFGKSFSEYISGIRMARAEELLLHSNRKVKEIASMVGYKDSNYFIRSFKKSYGITPDEFRKKGNLR